MLTKVILKNFKSFKDSEIPLKKFNVLIGPNASGKSNFLNALEFFSSDKSIPDLVSENGGYKAISFGNYEENIIFKCEFTLKNKDFAYEFEISNKNKRPQLEREILKVNKKVVFEVNRGKNEFFTLTVEDTELEINSNYLNQKQLPFQIKYGNIGSKEDILDAWAFISSWRVYNFIPHLMKKTLPIKRETVLSKYGDNLAQVLHTFLTERRNIFLEVEDTLKEAIPEIEELLTPLSKNNEVSIAVRESGFEDKFSFYQISDGTFRLLAYITALNTESQLLAFEEPENSVHPWLLKLLIDVLKESNKQIILTTHSPRLLDNVDLGDILVVEKEKNASKFYRISSEKEIQKIKRMLESGVPLGEQWVSNVFGGMPWK